MRAGCAWMLMMCWCLYVGICGEVIRFVFFFFFQAEDGIRDHCVTGVQTCALPILDSASRARFRLCKCSAFSLPTNARRGYGTLHSLPSGGGSPSPLSASCSRSRQRDRKSVV